MTGRPATDEILSMLLKMRERLSDADNWCTHALQRGHRHCLLGEANFQATGDAEQLWGDGTPHQSVVILLHRTSVKLFDQSTAEANNTLGHAAVLKIIDHAIDARTEELGCAQSNR